jgi:AcrR family transcriptional regulator
MERRKYHSTIRQEHAEQTRCRIRDAARKLFSQRGFTGTTVRSIAEVAGVAEQTVYATFGSKSTIFAALLDSIEEEAGIEELNERLANSADDPIRQLGMIVSFDRRIFELADGLYDSALLPGSAAPEMIELSLGGRARNRGGKAALVEALAAKGLLRPGLTVGDAADIAATLSSHEVYRLLVVDSGWSADRFEDWLIDALRQQLLGQP